MGMLEQAASLKTRLKERTSPFQQHLFHPTTSTTSGATTNRQDSGDIRSGKRNDRWGSSATSHWNESLKESIHTEIVRKPEYTEWKSEPKQISVFQPMVFRVQIIQKQNEFLNGIGERCRKKQLALVEALEAYRVVKDRLQMLTSNMATKISQRHPAILNGQKTIQSAIKYFTKMKSALATTFQIPVSKPQSREQTMILEKSTEKEVIVEKLDMWEEQQPPAIPFFQFKIHRRREEINETPGEQMLHTQIQEIKLQDIPRQQQHQTKIKKQKRRQSTQIKSKFNRKSDIPHTTTHPEVRNGRYSGGREGKKHGISKTMIINRKDKRKSSELPELALVMEEIEDQNGEEASSDVEYEIDDAQYMAMTPTKTARKKKMRDFTGYFMNTFTPGQVEHLKEMSQWEKKKKRLTMMQRRDSSDNRRMRKGEQAELSQFVKKNERMDRQSQDLMRLTGQFNQFNRSSRLTRRKHVFFKGPTPQGSTKFMQVETSETPSHIIETAQGKKIDLRTVNFDNLLTNVNVKKRIHKETQIAKIELVLDQVQPATKECEELPTQIAVQEAIKVLLDPHSSFVKNRDTIVKECENLSRVLGQNDEQTVRLQKMMGRDEKKAIDFIVKKIKNSQKLGNQANPFEIIDEIRGAVAANELYGHRVLQLMQHFVKCRIVRRITTQNEEDTNEIGNLPTEIRTRKVDMSRYRHKMESKLIDLISVMPMKFDEDILQQRGLWTPAEMA